MIATMIPPTFDLSTNQRQAFYLYADSPDGLENDETPSDTIRSDLHDVNLADNLQYTDTRPVAQLSKSLRGSGPFDHSQR